MMVGKFISRIFLFFGLICLTLGVAYGQTTNNKIIEFVIKQTVLPGSSLGYEYHYKAGVLSAYRNTTVWRGEDYVGKSKRIYKKKLSKNNIRLLDSIIYNLDVLSFDSSYSTPTIDGVYWEFLFYFNGKFKKVDLDNYYLKELDVLLVFVNQQLPKKKRYINFDIFGVKSEIM
jgi:hypothetical protein